MALFGNDNGDLLRQILGQIGKAGEDLAALKQQVADQQHAIDQIRQDTTAAINTGLTENRAVIRDGLNRTNDTISDPLTHIGSELVAIRSGLHQLTTRADNPPPSAKPEPEPQPAESLPTPTGEPENTPAPQPAETAQQEPPHPDPGILRAAAGIAHATIEAHRDTWAFLIQVAGNEQHFHIPGKVKDDDGFVSVRLSGPSLVAAITSLAATTRSADSPVTQAIADHIQGKITDAVQAVIDRPRAGADGTPVCITIDDRAQADDTPSADQAAAR